MPKYWVTGFVNVLILNLNFYQLLHQQALPENSQKLRTVSSLVFIVHFIANMWPVSISVYFSHCAIK